MSTGYKIEDQNSLYYVTLQIEHWIDIFTRKNYRYIIIENLKYCQQNKGLEIYGYVIMSNHIHLLIKSDKGTLSSTLRDFKSYTSKQILQIIQSGQESRSQWMLHLFSFSARSHTRNQKYQLWTHENHAEEIYSQKFIRQKLDYIHSNPVRAEIVKNPEDYLYSSARNYAGLPALLDVELLDLGVSRNLYGSYKS